MPNRLVQIVKSRILPLVAVLLVFGGGVLAIGKLKQSKEAEAKAMEDKEFPPRPVRVAPAHSVGTNDSVSYPGSVAASRTAKLAFRVGGPLVQIDVELGKAVAEGQLLMHIDPRDYESSVAAAESRLAAAKARLDAMEQGDRVEDIRASEAKLQAAKARLEHARLAFDRVQKLYQENVVPKADFDTADSALRVATASVDELEQELVKARAGARPEDIAAAKANIRGLETALKVARDQLADTELRAPFAGVVVSQFIENHEMVTPGMPVLAMQDISELEIKVNVPETELVRQTNWQEFVAIASFATVPDRSFPVTLKEFSTEADSSTRTYAVTFSLPQPDDINLLPGMTAEVRRQLRDGVAPTDTTVAVPAKAVLTDGNGLRYVWVLPAGAELAERRTVTCGALAGEDDIRILEGLTVGDPVIVAGANFITEHTPVRAMP